MYNVCGIERGDLNEDTRVVVVYMRKSFDHDLSERVKRLIHRLATDGRRDTEEGVAGAAE